MGKGGGGKAPQTPIYVPPAPYVAPPDPQSVVPPVMSTGQIVGAGVTTENQLASKKNPGLNWLSLNNLNGGMNPEGLAKYEANYDQTENQPAIKALSNSVYNNGQAYGSYGGAAVGAATAQGALNKYQAGLDYAQQLYNNVLQGRSSFFAGGPAIAMNQNALDVQRGLGVAGLQSQNTGMQNNYNLGAAGMQNGFNQQNFGNQMQLYAQQQQAAQNRAMGIGGLITGGLGLAGNLFTGGGGGLTNLFKASAPATNNLLGGTGGSTLGIGNFGLGVGANFA